MPYYKYAADRLVTLVEGLPTGRELSEHHADYRTWSREIREAVPMADHLDDFVFDRIGEISCSPRYLPEGSAINLRRSVAYGLGVLATAVLCRLHRWGWGRSPLFADIVRQKP